MRSRFAALRCNLDNHRVTAYLVRCKLFSFLCYQSAAYAWCSPNGQCLFFTPGVSLCDSGAHKPGSAIQVRQQQCPLFVDGALG